MKKILALLLAASCLAAPFNLYADDNDGGTTPPPPPPPIQIPIEPTTPPPSNPDPGKINPRSLSPISGWCANGSVELYFSSDLGAVDIAVTNNTSGEVWFTTAESSEGFIAIAINPQPGDYTVTIQTETAGTFVGEFCL